MKAGAVLIALGGLAGAMPAVQAQGDPTIGACTRYAEGECCFENAKAEAEADYEAAVQKAVASYRASSGRLRVRVTVPAAVGRAGAT